VPCGSVAKAFAFIQSIRNFLYSHSEGTFNAVVPAGAALTWGGISPDPIVRNTSHLFTIGGTGFSFSNINAVKWDDGAGAVLVGTPTITDDGHMTVFLGQFPNMVDDGIVYYSTDSGATWTTTGLGISLT